MKKTWNHLVSIDSDWAGDSENHISITEFIIYFLGTLIYWRSKDQKGVTISSSETNMWPCMRQWRRPGLFSTFWWALGSQSNYPSLWELITFVQSSWQKIYPRESVPDILISGTVSFVSTWRMVLFKLFLWGRTKMMLVSLLRMCTRKFMRSMFWSSLESSDVIEWCVIGWVLESINWIQWVVSHTFEITYQIVSKWLSEY
jgi:hypothetical protein